MAYHTLDEDTELKLECVRVAVAGGYSPTQTMYLAFDLYDWCVTAPDDADTKPDTSKMN